MGVPDLRSVASRPCVIAQESAFYQGSTENVLANIVGVFEELRILGRFRDDL